MKIVFVGDPHGLFDPVLNIANKEKADLVILTGDQTPEEPLDKVFSRFPCPVRFILGNHDSDQDHFIQHHLPVWDNNIGGKVTEFDGVRIAGLGGVFRGTVWNPKQEDIWRFYDRASFLNHCRPNTKFLDWLPRKQWASIFPEDFDILQDQGPADVLICHQPPSNHHMGFQDIDRLTEIMGVKMVIHGHHHAFYETVLENKVKVVGLGIMSVTKDIQELGYYVLDSKEF